MKWSDNLWDLFKEELFPISSTNDLFNQYKDLDLRVDLQNANKIRKQNLFNYMNSFSKKPTIMMIGEAAGPWGCRFSGIPFTGEEQLINNLLNFHGIQSSKEKPLLKIRKTPPYNSQSAKIFWNVMLPYNKEFFVWDCVPLHSHKIDKILSVRNPRKKEIYSFADILNEIIIAIRPKLIIAIGRKAEIALKKNNVESIYVRHPARGGSIEFNQGIRKLFNSL